MQSAEINLIATALAKAQANIHCPSRNREVKVRTRAGDTYKFAYTTFDNLIEAVRGPLTSNGIWFVQSYDEWDNDPAVMTTLVHSSGQWFSTTTPMFLEERPTNQAFGSAFTYSRRYGLSAALGLSSEEDDDANSADGNQAEGKDRPSKSFDGGFARPSTPPKQTEIRGDTMGNVHTVFLPPVDPVTGKVTPHQIVASNVVEWGGVFIAALDQAKSRDEVLAWEKANTASLTVVRDDAPKVYAKLLVRLVEARNRFGAIPPAEKGDIVVNSASDAVMPFFWNLDKVMGACKTRKGIEAAWAKEQAEIDKLTPTDFDAFAKMFDVHMERVAPRKQ